MLATGLILCQSGDLASRSVFLPLSDQFDTGFERRIASIRRNPPNLKKEACVQNWASLVWKVLVDLAGALWKVLVDLVGT